MGFYELSIEELEAIDGGSVWKYICAIGAIGFGIYEVSTGVGAADGAKNIVTGVTAIGGGILQLFS